MTSAPKRLQSPDSQESGFTFSGRHRVFKAVEAVPFAWPTKSRAANEYIKGWRELAGEILANLSLSRKTAFCIASHVSRRDGTCRLTDKAISARAERSLRSTKRDLYRLKMLGLLLVEYEADDSRQSPVRALKIAVPGDQSKGPRVPPPSGPEQGPTCTPHVGPLDIGEPLDV